MITEEIKIGNIYYKKFSISGIRNLEEYICKLQIESKDEEGKYWVFGWLDDRGNDILYYYTEEQVRNLYHTKEEAEQQEAEFISPG